MTNTTASQTLPPLLRTIDALQDAGRDVFIHGIDASGTYALVVDNDRQQVTVAHLATTSGLGRWECSREHMRAYMTLYCDRFPNHLETL